MEIKNKGLDESGSVMILSLIIITLITVLGIAASTSSMIEMHIAANDRHHKQCFYAAEAGIEHVRAILTERFAVMNGPKIASSQTPDWDFALAGPDQKLGTGDDVKDMDGDGIGSFEEGSVWLEKGSLDSFHYTVTLWNNEGEHFQDDEDALIWARSIATGPHGAMSTIQVSLLGSTSGLPISGTTGRAGDGRDHTSTDRNAIDPKDLDSRQL